MTVAILQPGYLPWLGFFDQMRRASMFVLYDDVQYDKHGWRNRNRIKSPNGPHWLTVPVLHSGQHSPRIKDVRIDNRTPWRRKHLETLRQQYARAPYAAAFLPAFADVLGREWERLIDLNGAMMGLVADWLEISTPVVMASTLGIGGEQSGRLLEICRHFGARRYLSGDAARDYLDVAMFAEAGIEVEWQNYQHPIYSQLYGSFASHLSAVDLILNCGPDSAAILGASNARALDDLPKTEHD